MGLALTVTNKRSIHHHSILSFQLQAQHGFTKILLSFSRQHASCYPWFDSPLGNCLSDHSAKVLLGVLIECDPSIKSIIVAIDSDSHDFIIEDLDDERVVVKENMVPALKAKLEEVCISRSAVFPTNSPLPGFCLGITFLHGSGSIALTFPSV